MENVKTINCIALNELKLLIASKQQQVKILDVRSKQEYIDAHIPGAIHLAVSEIEMANKLFDKNDFIITVCGKGGGRSMQAAGKLQESGFKNSVWLCSGTFGWISSTV